MLNYQWTIWKWWKKHFEQQLNVDIQNDLSFLTTELPS